MSCRGHIGLSYSSSYINLLEIPFVTWQYSLQVRGDDYGEFINLEDFDVSALKDENKENIDLQIPYDDDDMMGEDGLVVILPLHFCASEFFPFQAISFIKPF